MCSRKHLRLLHAQLHILSHQIEFGRLRTHNSLLYHHTPPSTQSSVVAWMILLNGKARNTSSREREVEQK